MNRIYGWALTLGSPLTLIGLINHPTGMRSDDFADVMRSMVAIIPANTTLHATLLAITVVVALGYVGLARRLGLDRPMVQLGLIAHFIGVVAAFSAATVDGFIFGRISTIYLARPVEEVEIARGLFAIAASWVWMWGRVWLIAFAFAMAIWSTQLLRGQGAARLLGLYGLGAGLIIAPGLITGFLPQAIPVTAAVFGALALWGTAAGILLLRGDLQPAGDELESVA